MKIIGVTTEVPANTRHREMDAETAEIMKALEGLKAPEMLQIEEKDWDGAKKLAGRLRGLKNFKKVNEVRQVGTMVYIGPKPVSE